MYIHMYGLLSIHSENISMRTSLGQAFPSRLLYISIHIKLNDIFHHFSVYYLQSVPILQAKQLHRIVTESPDPVNSQLMALNKALVQLSDEGPLPNGRPMTYHMESIERPRKRKGVKNGRNRLSYVEHSYNQLTNDMYSGGNSIDVVSR